MAAPRIPRNLGRRLRATIARMTADLDRGRVELARLRLRVALILCQRIERRLEARRARSAQKGPSPPENRPVHAIVTGNQVKGRAVLLGASAREDPER